MILLISIALAVPLSSGLVLKGEALTMVPLTFFSILASRGWMDSMTMSSLVFHILDFVGCVINTPTRVIWIFLLFEELKPNPKLNIFLFLS